jgi:hypothetical protein
MEKSFSFIFEAKVWKEKLKVKKKNCFNVGIRFNHHFMFHTTTEADASFLPSHSIHKCSWNSFTIGTTSTWNEIYSSSHLLGYESIKFSFFTLHLSLLFCLMHLGAHCVYVWQTRLTAIIVLALRIEWNRMKTWDMAEMSEKWK